MSHALPFPISFTSNSSFLDDDTVGPQPDLYRSITEPSPSNARHTPSHLSLQVQQLDVVSQRMLHVIDQLKMRECFTNREPLPPAVGTASIEKTMDITVAKQTLQEFRPDLGLSDLLLECSKQETLRNACLALLHQNPVAWVDGVFDLTHYGHMYTFLMARRVVGGGKLIVGVNSDASVHAAKGTKPIIPEEDRIKMVEACKFVDHVEKDVPYVMDSTYLQEVIDKHGLTAICHGNDPCFDVNGQDVYAEVKERGLFKEIPRVVGISTTDLIGRMLLHIRNDYQVPGSADENTQTMEDMEKSLTTSKWRFTPTGEVMCAFLQESKVVRNKDQPAVYIDGAWDMLHAGHVRTLELVTEDAKRELAKSSEQKPYLIVGVLPDSVVSRWAPHRPIMNLHERALALMATRPVDDIVMDAPEEVSAEFMRTHNIHLVYRCISEVESEEESNAGDRFSDPKKSNKYRHLQVPYNVGLDIDHIIKKVKGGNYGTQHRRKSTREAAFYEATFEPVR